MARMKIDLPQEWKFTFEISVRVNDLNYGNHLANQNFLAFAQEARMAYYAKYELSELDFGGVSLIQADAAIVFKGEGFYNDRIQIELSAVQNGNSSFNIFYRFSNLDSKKELAHVRTAMVCYDYKLKKPVGIPQSVINSGLFVKT
ncbi:MAG: thioesterase family protein [Bacteroidia bacterium]